MTIDSLSDFRSLFAFRNHPIISNGNVTEEVYWLGKCRIPSSEEVVNEPRVSDSTIFMVVDHDESRRIVFKACFRTGYTLMKSDVCIVAHLSTSDVL